MSRFVSKLLIDKRLHAGVSTAPQVLAGLDIFAGHVGIPVALVYRHGPTLAQLEASLQATLRQYPLVCGRLKKGPDGHTYIDPNDAGIAYRVHQCGGALPAYGHAQPMGDAIKRFFKPFMPWQVVDKDLPLLQVDVHVFEDGGMVLCCYGPHSVFDGSAYWQFMMDWSVTCRGLQPKPVTFERGLVIAAGQREVPPDLSGLLYDPTMRERIAAFARLGWRALWLKKGVFRIPAATIERWKDDARRELPAEAGGVSSVELVTAHCLKAISPLLPPQHERAVGIVLDLRHKRRLKIPRDHFGNALGYGEARYTPQALATQSLPLLAQQCRPAPEQVSTEALFNFLALMETYRQKKAIWRLFWRSAGETLRAGLVLNNCIHFPIYDIDFGTGTPAWYDICAVTFRMLMVVQTPEKDGGVDLHFTAHPRELAALRASLQALA